MNQKMNYICVLLLMTLNVVFCYYFYNPTSHDLVIRTSLNHVPVGYKLLPPPKSLRGRSRSSKSRLNGSCTDGGFTCSTPYDRSLTFQFECTNDEQCPSNYKCCSQKCFVHKICVKARLPRTNNNNASFRRTGQCEKWPYNCPVPYHHSLTYLFECNRDSQCPRNFKCCEQNCFTHRICSRIITGTRPEPEKIEVSTAKPLIPGLLEREDENENSEVGEINGNEEEDSQVTTTAETGDENEVDNNRDTEPEETTNNEDNGAEEEITNEDEDTNIVDEEITTTEEAELNPDADIELVEEETTTKEETTEEETPEEETTEGETIEEETTEEETIEEETIEEETTEEAVTTEVEQDNREEEEATTEEQEIENEGGDISESVDSVGEGDENNNTADDSNNLTNDNNFDTDTEQIIDTTALQEDENTTLDPNAIGPDYSDFYYDNSTETDENVYEDEDDVENNEYEDDYEAKK